MKQQKINKQSAPKHIEVIDERTPKPQQQVAESDVPVRTVIYMEVGDMERERVLYLVKQVSASYENSKGTHYVLPVRHGKVSGEIGFEKEWEEVVREAFEIRDGQICLKGGAREVTIVREIV
jgi:hypothetical protein